MKRRYSGQSRTTRWRKRKRYEEHVMSGQDCGCAACLEAANNLSDRQRGGSSSSSTTSSGSVEEIGCHEEVETAEVTQNHPVLEPQMEEIGNQKGMETPEVSEHNLINPEVVLTPSNHSVEEPQGSLAAEVVIPEESSDESSDNESSSTSTSSSSDGSDGDQPPPGDDPSSSEGSPSSSDSEDNFNLDSEHLNEELVVLQRSTVRDALALYLAIAVRHDLTYEALMAILKGQNTLLGGGCLPNDKRKLWRILKRTKSGVTVIPYCKICLSVIEDVNNEPIVCVCGEHLDLKDVKHFVHVSLKKQLKLFLNSPAAHNLGYRETRVKTRIDAIEDIFDGAAYKQLQENGIISPNDFTYTFNTDGLRLFKSGTLEAWPLYIRLNEVSPNLRQKCTFLAGLWIDDKKPNFNKFLRPFVKEANKLSSEGISWVRNGEAVTSKFIPTCLCVDAKARAPLLNMKDVTGYHGCTFCTHEGVFFGESKLKFPMTPNPPAFDFEPPVLRTCQGMLRDMTEAANLPNDADVNGHKGATELMNLDNFDLFINQVTDDLHPMYEGAAKTHLKMFLKRNRPYSLSPDNIKIVNLRLQSAKTPTHTSRKPRTRIDKSSKWKGSEYRNWLIHYSIPCLDGLLPRRYLNHWALLANAAFLLHKTVITEEDLLNAERSLQLYLELYQFYFGPENMRFNLHVLSHSVQCVRNWGPMWTQSTFHFESWNFRLLRCVKSAYTSMDQVVTRFLLHLMTERTSLDNAISPHVRREIKKIIGEKIHLNVTSVEDAHFLGCGRLGELADEERNALENAGIFCAAKRSFDRVLFKCKEFRSLQYHPHSKSNNTWIYLKDDQFCQIQSVVLITDIYGNQHSGVFVKQCHVRHSAVNAGFMACVELTNAVEYVSLNNILGFCVKVESGRDLFLSPIPNQHEID